MPSTPTNQIADSFVGLIPGRLFDSRDGAAQRVGPSAVTEVAVSGRFGVPADATAAVISVTITEPTSSGYATVYPCGSVPPLASHHNFVAGQTVSNAVSARIGGGGQVCVVSTALAHLVVDVNGAHSPSSAGGRLQPLIPSRLFDSRNSMAAIEPGAVTEVQVGGLGGVAADAGAAVLNVTIVDPSSDGYTTIYPCGTPRPLASHVNFVTAKTVANSVTATLGTGGRVCIFSTARTHLVVDVTGAFSPSGAGHLESVVPVRLLDTREVVGGLPNANVIHVLTVQGSALAADLNVTVVDPLAAGHTTVYPCSSTRPLASNLNFTSGQTVANAATVAIDGDGRVCVASTAAAQIVVDLNGMYTG